jgi:hypothetical protein
MDHWPDLYLGIIRHIRRGDEVGERGGAGAVEQIVAREPRERACYDAFVIQGCHYRAAA